MYMNEYDIMVAARVASYHDWPVMASAVAVINRLRIWTDEHSDGWAYWRQPGNAARQLMELIQEQERKSRIDWPEQYDMTYNDRDRALRPIKAFITRQINGGGSDERDRLFILEGVRL